MAIHSLVYDCTHHYRALGNTDAHLLWSMYELSFRTVVRDTGQAHFITNELFSPPVGAAVQSSSGPVRLNSPSKCIHYPHNPSSLVQCVYLKPACKCAIFGICCEGILRQVNYRINEASDTGKGANTKISLLHHFLGHRTGGSVRAWRPRKR